MAALSALASVTTAANGLANLILVTPSRTYTGYQPQNPLTNDGSASTASLPPTLAFHYEGEQSSTLESDITDHYVEDNSAIQDQIALKPETITTHGYIGELNDLAPNSQLAAIAQTITQKLTVIGGYLPTISTTAQLAYNEAVFLYETAAAVANSAVSLYSSINGGGGGPSQAVLNGNSNPITTANGKTIAQNQNKQQIMYQQFYGYWKSKTLFTVQTPWCVFQNMAIKSIRAIQDAETQVTTDFELSFKIIRYASTSTSLNLSLSPFNNANFQNRAFNQGANAVQLGTVTPAASTLNFGTAIGTSAGQ